ncbi:MAG: hypothetical protein ACRDWS_10260 [Acidimicrobiia bacterium]
MEKTQSTAGASYAAIGIPEPEGDAFSAFIHVGMSDELVAEVGPLPRTHGSRTGSGSWSMCGVGSARLLAELRSDSNRQRTGVDIRALVMSALLGDQSRTRRSHSRNPRSDPIKSRDSRWKQSILSFPGHVVPAP